MKFSRNVHTDVYLRCYITVPFYTYKSGEHVSVPIGVWNRRYVKSQNFLLFCKRHPWASVILLEIWARHTLNRLMIHVLFKLASTIYQTYLHGPWRGWHGRTTEVPELLIGTMPDDTAAGVPAPSFASLDFIFSVYCLWWRSDKSNQIYWINGNSLQWHPVGRKVRWGEDSLYSTNEAEGTQREPSKYR